MRKIYYSFLVLALMMVSTVAKAQYTVSVTSDPENNYFSGYQAFDPTEIATALDTDTATLHQLITAGGAVYIKTAEGDKSNTYTGNKNEFWMGTNGQAQGYGDDGTCWYVGISYDAGGEVDEETGETSKAEVDVAMGQMPDFFKKIYTNSELKTTLYLVNGEKEISFDVTLNVNAAPEPTLPAPANKFSEIEVVKEYAATLEYTEGKEYGDFKVEVDMADAAEALGYTEAEIANSLSDITLTRYYAPEGDSYVLSDSLVAWDSQSDGWFGRYESYDEANDKTTVYLENAPHTWGTNATYYIHDIALSEGKFTFVHGQYPGTFKEGDTDFANLYIIAGNKAVKLTVTVNITAPEIIDPNQMVQVGEQTVTITSQANPDYSTKSFTVDMDAVVTALECTVDDIDDFLAWAAEGQLSDNHTTSGNGYYFNQEGYIDTWGNKAPVYIDPANLPEGKFNIGQYGGIYSDITEDVLFKTQLIFQNGTKYYAINVEYTITPPKQAPEDLEYKLASTETLSMQIIPSSTDWAYGTTSTIDLEYINGLIGTNDFVLYTDKADSEGKLAWSKTYTCTPNPGFWYGTTTYENEEHQVVVDNAGWGTNSFGLTYASGEITWYQYPGQRAAGDQFEANLYLVNEETGDYIKYILYVKYVEEVTPEAELAGKEDTLFLVSSEMYDDNYGAYVARVDMSKAFEALGITEELAPNMAEICTVFAPKSQTIFETKNVEEAIFFNKDGYCVNDEDANGVLSATLSIEEDGTPILVIDDQGYFETENATTKVQIGLEYEGKRYLHVITFTNDEELATGIEAAAAPKAVAGIYNAAGVKVNALQKGINIVKYANGETQKVFVK